MTHWGCNPNSCWVRHVMYQQEVGWGWGATQACLSPGPPSSLSEMLRSYSKIPSPSPTPCASQPRPTHSHHVWELCWLHEATTCPSTSLPSSRVVVNMLCHTFSWEPAQGSRKDKILVFFFRFLKIFFQSLSALLWCQCRKWVFESGTLSFCCLKEGLVISPCPQCIVFLNQIHSWILKLLGAKHFPDLHPHQAHLYYIELHPVVSLGICLSKRKTRYNFFQQIN